MNALTRIIVVGFITLALLGALGYEMYLIGQAQGELSNATESADLQIGSDSRARSIALLQESVKADTAVIDEVILTKSDLVALVERLEKAGRDIGLSISISSITNDSKVVSSTNPETVRITIESRGSWASSLSYVRLIESLPHKVGIDKVEMAVDGQGWRTLINLKLTTYPER